MRYLQIRSTWMYSRRMVRRVTRNPIRSVTHRSRSLERTIDDPTLFGRSHRWWLYPGAEKYDVVSYLLATARTHGLPFSATDAMLLQVL